MDRLNFDIHKGQGTPLLLVHGFLSSRAQWQLNLEALSEVCTPVTVELYGHGRSPSPLEKDAYSPANYLCQFDAIRQSLGVEKWFLCGYSLGAGLTIRYAFEYSRNTIAHVFTNSTSAFSPRPEMQRSADSIIQHFQEGGLKTIENIPVHPRFAKQLPESIKRMLVEDALLLNPAAIGRCIAYTNSSVSVRDELQQNTRPALLICGAEEKRFRDHRKLIETMPEINLVDLPAGHAVNMQCPEQFNEAITSFIKRHNGHE
jgi:pimeloyl-ACP methyl ester carboxylesterase